MTVIKCYGSGTRVFIFAIQVSLRKVCAQICRTKSFSYYVFAPTRFHVVSSRLNSSKAFTQKMQKYTYNFCELISVRKTAENNYMEGSGSATIK